MKIQFFVKNKYHPYIQKIMEERNSIFKTTDFLGINVGFQLNEDIQQQYSSFIDSDLKMATDSTIEDLLKFFELMQQQLKEKFDIPSDSILYRIVNEDTIPDQ